MHRGEEVLEGVGGAEPAYPLKAVKPERFKLRRAGEVDGSCEGNLLTLDCELEA